MENGFTIFVNKVVSQLLLIQAAAFVIFLPPFAHDPIHFARAGRDGLHRLLMAGGAEILPSEEPSPAVAQQATHLFVESDKEHAQAKELAAALPGVVPLKADF